MSILHVVSVSTGKDSAATAILALETQPRNSLRFVSCDTGNEDDGFHPYLDYMRRALDIEIDVLKADLSGEVLRRRDYVREHWPAEGLTQADVDRAVAALVPTGNPFLDLCLWKGRFPSRRAQFCTQFLKTEPLVEHQLGFIERGDADAVWSWQGVRIDESEARRTRLQGTGACVRSFDVAGGGLFNYRPILRWNVGDVFEAHRIAGLEPNPLYRQGMTRVGCMPCINASKDEVLAISKRFPHHIERIAYWEACVKQTAKRQDASFFPDPHRDAHLNRRGIRNVVSWAQTKRGGQQLDWIRINEEPKACESAYGLCE
jgi:3'-phosphoadenosine 5'-phosphosulfate sulfotransferase (PAPS reductase)/FAD synthetase